MVTWGPNQTFTFAGANAPAGSTATAQSPAPSATGFSFGSSPAPSGGGLFGSTPATAAAPTTSAFGTSPAPAPFTGFGGFGASSQPAPAGASLFGSTPAPSGGGLFGSTTPAPASSGSFFGSTPAAPAPGGSFFGSSTPAPAAPAGPQIPAHAAMQAHLDASARQEAAKLQTALEKYHKAYTGAPTTDKEKFVTIVYNDITPQQRQMQWLMRGQTTVAPPKPPTVSDKEWLEAVVRNPDPESFMPVALVGAMELQTRVAWQQDRANSYEKSLHGIQAAQKTLQQRCDQTATELQTLGRIHTTLRSRLLQVMRKVELARCMNFGLLQDEVTLKHRLDQLLKQVDQVNKMLAAAQAKATGQTQRVQTVPIVNVPDERELSRVLKGHRETLTNMSQVVEKDKRDVALLRHHVVPKVPLPPPH